MNRADVIEFFEQHAIQAQAEKRLKELRPDLLTALQAGEESPQDLPYLLVLGNQERTVRDYCKPLQRLLRRIYGKVRGEKRLRQIEGAFASIDVPTVHVRQNPEYAAQLGESEHAA